MFGQIYLVTLLRILSVLTGLALLQACTVMPQTGGLDESGLRKEVAGAVRIRDINPSLIASLSLTNVKGNIGCATGICPENWDYLIGPGDVLSIVGAG